jgi:hypothetical protein
MSFLFIFDHFSSAKHASFSFPTLLGIEFIIGRYIMGKVFSVRQLLAAFSPDLVSQNMYVGGQYSHMYALAHIEPTFLFLASFDRTPMATSGQKKS